MHDVDTAIDNHAWTLNRVIYGQRESETFLEDITSKVSSLEFDVSTVRGRLLDDEDKIENRTQTLNSVTQRVSQTETFLEDINSKVSTLKYDVSVFRMLLDDEDKIENQTQTLDSVTQRLSQTETSLEDITSKVSSFEFAVSAAREWLLDDEAKIKSHAQTLNSVTERLSECESSIQTMHSRFTFLMYKTTDSSNDLFERRLHVTEEQSTSNNRNCRELADSRDLHEQEIQPLKKRIEELEMAVQARDSNREKPSVQTLPHVKVPVTQPVGQTANVAVRSTLLFNAPKGTNKIYVRDQQLFQKGQTIIIGQCFVAKIIDYGSLVLDRPVDQDYPSGTTVRAITPQDVHGVSGQELQSTIGIPNSQGISDQISDQSNPSGRLTENTGAYITPLNDWWPPAPQPIRSIEPLESNRPTVNDAVWSTLGMSALQGTNRIYVHDQQLFRKGQVIIIHELFVAQIIDFGSLVLDRNLDQTFPADAIVRVMTPQEIDDMNRQNRQSTQRIPKEFSNQNGDRSRILPDLPEENTSEIDAETSPLKAWLLRGMNRHGKAHWADCREYYREHQPTVAELDKSFRLPKPDQMRQALDTVTLPVRRLEQTFIRVMKGLTPSCVLYAKLLFNGVYEYLTILREERTASGQADKQFNQTTEEEKFHPQLESHVVTWVTSKLSNYELSRAYNRRSEPSARIYLTEYYFSVLPQPEEQARRLGYVARSPSTVSANPTDVLSNIENWRASSQKLNELTNWIPMKEDIKTAFESLIAPLVEHVSGFELNRQLIKRKAYASITTTDADVYKYITSIQEEILKLPRSTQWKEADSQECQEEAYDAYSQEQDDVEEADEGFDVDKWHEEMYGPYDDETHQEDWDGDDAYQDQEDEGYDDEAYDGYDDGTYEQEGYDDEAYDGYDDEAYDEEEGYDNEAWGQEEGYDDEAYEGYDDGTYEQEG